MVSFCVGRLTFIHAWRFKTHTYLHSIAKLKNSSTESKLPGRWRLQPHKAGRFHGHFWLQRFCVARPRKPKISLDLHLQTDGCTKKSCWRHPIWKISSVWTYDSKVESASVDQNFVLIELNENQSSMRDCAPSSRRWPHHGFSMFLAPSSMLRAQIWPNVLSVIAERLLHNIDSCMTSCCDQKLQSGDIFHDYLRWSLTKTEQQPQQQQRQ